MGAAGDMLSGALLDLMPNPEAALDELNALKIPHVRFGKETLVKCGISSTHLKVLVSGHEEDEQDHHDHHHEHSEHHYHHHHSHHNLSEVLNIIKHLALEDKIREDAERIYELLAAAESRAHGRDVGEVHFHEVGALDAIADITAFCYLVNRLNVDKIISSPIHVGCGSVECAHGVLPVPAPATAFLLEGLSTYSDGVVTGELCTPTGAAIIKYFASSIGPQPLMKIIKVALGAGKKDFPRANILRATLGETEESAEADGEISELDFNVDDMTGEELSFAAERIFSQGARDVSFAPVTMKKGRPGHRVSVMCSLDKRQDVVKAIFANTSTLGIREVLCRRYTLNRKIETIQLENGISARLKIASGYGVERAKWEADDLSEIARNRNISLSEAKFKLDTRKGAK